MTENRKHPTSCKAAWPLGLLLATAMLLIAWFACSMSFATNDDTLILRQMMGFGVTELPDFNLYIHFLLLYPLRWLSLAFPGQPWFSWMQLFLLWLSAAVIAKSILQCFAHADKPLWAGLLTAVLFLGVFLMRYMAQVSYTVTAALLGAAAVLQLMSIDTERVSGGSWFRSALLSLLMALLGYSMRQMTALPSMAFCGIAFLVQGIRRFNAGQDWKKPLIATALAVAVVFGAACGLREIEINADEEIREYVEWQQQRIRMIDYYDLNDIPAQVREAHGLTDARLALMIDWYLMDGDLDADTLRAFGDALEAAQDSSLSARLDKAAQTLKAFPANEPLAAKSLPVVGALALFCAIALLCGGKRSRFPQWLGLGLGWACLTVMVLYLASKGRLPMRGLWTAVMPFAALLAGLLPACLPLSSHLPGKAVTCVMAACTILLCALYLVPMADAIAKRPLSDEAQTANDTFGALDDYGVCNEEYLLITDGTLSGDTRMFPTTEFGISTNIISYGGWETHSPAHNQLLQRYGFDPDEWSLSCFLEDNVRLVRGGLEPPPQLIIDGLNEIVEVDWYLDSEWDGIYSLYFEEW